MTFITLDRIIKVKYPKNFTVIFSNALILMIGFLEVN